jgi:hypothetical protein
MRKDIIRLCATAVVAIAGATDSMAAGNAYTRGCAARDIQIMMMLEAGPVSPQKMTVMMRNVVHARMMCFDGHVMDALALYDDIASSIASDWILSSQGP